jgi:hypothetical protein
MCFVILHEALGEETTVSPYKAYFLVAENGKGLIKKGTVITQISRIARTHPGIHYHAHIGHEGNKRVMGRPAGLVGVITDFGSFLFSVSCNNATVQIKSHIIKMKLFEEPTVKRREYFIIALPGELMEEPAVSAL